MSMQVVPEKIAVRFNNIHTIHAVRAVNTLVLLLYNKQIVMLT